LKLKSIKINKNTFTNALAVLAAIIFGFVIIFLIVYVFIPTILQDANEKIETDFAARLYNMTFETQTENTSEIVAVAKSEADTKSAQQAFTQSDQVVLLPRDSFLSVLATNSDIIGRVSIAPDIKYLVTQTTDNEYYLEKGYNHENSREGAIFLDYRCDADKRELSGHYIIYGHHMKSGTMFAHLMEYKNEIFFYDNPIIRFDTLYADYKWEIFSAYVTDTNFYFIETNFNSDNDWLSFLNMIQQKSMFDTDVVLSPDDVVLTLCTCTYEFDDARFVIHARLVR